MPTKHTFKPGDRVRCIEPDGVVPGYDLAEGCYTVVHVHHSGDVQLMGQVCNGYRPSRFQLIHRPSDDQPEKRQLPTFTIDDVIQVLDRHKSCPDTKPWREHGYELLHRKWPADSSHPIDALQLTDVSCAEEDKEWLLLRLGTKAVPAEINSWACEANLRNQLREWLTEQPEPEWKKEMRQAWEDGELEVGGEGYWHPLPDGFSEPLFDSGEHWYRRRPKRQPQVGDVWSTSSTGRVIITEFKCDEHHPYRAFDVDRNCPNGFMRAALIAFVGRVADIDLLRGE